MLVSKFSFDLPRELIATSPAKPRESAKLLVISDEMQDLSIADIPSFFEKGDVVIFNDTKVIPAKLFGYRGEASVEITLHKASGDGIWKAFAKPARKLSVGDVFKVADDFYASVLSRNEGEVALEFNVKGDEFYSKLDKYGSPPLPPYIERKEKKPLSTDLNDYQTIYAKNKGAVAAPTAGLHFTEELIAKIENIGVIIEFVTLHVGAGTFLPMKVANTEDHIMHSEYGVISHDSANNINAAKNNGGRVFAVGTTSMRLLESATDDNGVVKPFVGDTDIFITPGYKFKAVDILITNFHLPESTLFMLVSAFCGLEKMQEAYSHAIDKKYRFYSYGDACLLKKSK
jgi:S-adenosylmethionine:tRNA ribosyltransferase-isomerase